MIDCVRCGKCLAVCPVYRKKREEEFSPRGRLLIDSAEGSPFQHCVGCMRCELSCPYNLSPLTAWETPFLWHNGPTDEKDFSIKNLHDLIYNFNLNEQFFKENFDQHPISDTLICFWLKNRGVECIFDKKPNEVHSVDGSLFNPFTPFQSPAIDPELERKWGKLIRRKQ